MSSSSRCLGFSVVYPQIKKCRRDGSAPRLGARAKYATISARGYEVNIHRTAIVHQDARIEAGVTVGPYCVIGPNVFIGAGSVLESHVHIERDTRIGEGCHIFSHAVLGSDPQDLKYDGAPTYAEV